jgi:twitching motility protein PilT
VDKGILPPETYRQLAAYMETRRGGMPAEPGDEDAGAPRGEETSVPMADHRPVRQAAPVVSQDTGEEPSWTPAAAPASPERTAGISGESGWTELLAHARASGASDLHLSAGNPILVRRNGGLQAITEASMSREQARRWVEQALDPEEAAEFDRKGDLELVRDHGGVRYRCTFLNQRRGCDITVRVIPDRIRTFEETGLPESCRELTRWAQGMVLVTGPVGCGKSTTLAALVEMVNRDRRDHIITLEEPIEYVYSSAGCRITQREVGRHTRSRDAALRAALREDPDIIVIAELRDMETIRLAVSAAETGHLVFGTMNTANASRTIYRLIDSFPPEEQAVVRSMISESLRGVISQQLLPLADGTGMVPAFEVLLVNSAVANMIRKEEIHQLGTAMLTGKSTGMVLLDDSLKALVEAGLVDPREAAARATAPKDFERYMGRGGR